MVRGAGEVGGWLGDSWPVNKHSIIEFPPHSVGVAAPNKVVIGPVVVDARLHALHGEQGSRQTTHGGG